MGEHSPVLAHQFEDLEQQQAAATAGMWIFLATEVLFFGGLFMAYTAYRYLYPEAWALASRQTAIALGTLNTAILLTSSLTMALGVHAAQTGRSRRTVVYLALTLVLGLGFLGIKFAEYAKDYHEMLVPGAHFAFPGPLASRVELFFWIYFAMTGLHALHMVIGVCLVLWIAAMAARGRFSPAYHTPVELVGLYWHFVDIIWIFLYPLLYLVERY